jgi:hypothetical protein
MMAWSLNSSSIPNLHAHSTSRLNVFAGDAIDGKKDDKGNSGMIFSLRAFGVRRTD